ncbi:hypothetical protein [Streptomyces sp. GDS52]|uniref:hypothetical protein n=1 Tax=Streptomyces sp. GDS52 TaxID=3406419 RepID=UPI003FD437EA
MKGRFGGVRHGGGVRCVGRLPHPDLDSGDGAQRLANHGLDLTPGQAAVAASELKSKRPLLLSLTAYWGQQVFVEAEDLTRLRLHLAGYEARPQALPTPS